MNVRSPIVVNSASFSCVKRRTASSLSSPTSPESWFVSAAHMVAGPAVGGSERPLGPWQMRLSAEALYLHVL